MLIHTLVRLLNNLKPTERDAHAYASIVPVVIYTARQLRLSDAAIYTLRCQLSCTMFFDLHLLMITGAILFERVAAVETERMWLQINFLSIN